MKKRLSSFIAGFLVASQILLSCAGIVSVRAETPPPSGTVNTGDYLQGGYIKRISVASDGTEGNKGAASTPSFSGDGRFVAFSSSSNNLVPGDTNGLPDLFVYDSQTGQIERVNVSSGGVETNDGDISDFKISPSGRYVAFSTFSKTLVPREQASTDVYIRDRLEGKTILANTSSDGIIGNGVSMYPSFGSNEDFVAFSSNASNIVPNDINNTNDVFIRNLKSGEIERISVASDGTEGNNSSSETSFIGSSISADGRFVIFVSTASNLISGETNAPGIYIRDRVNMTTKRILPMIDTSQGFGAEWLSISGNGTHVFFSSNVNNLVPGDTNGASDIFSYDISTSLIRRLDTPIDEVVSNTSSYGPSASTDGRFVVFESGAANLIHGDNNNSLDVFVYDLLIGQIVRVNVTEGGGEVFGLSGSASISGDGKYISFVSFASNLVPGDNNGTADIFLMKNPLYSVEAVSDTPNLSSLPVLPYDFNIQYGEPYYGSHYMKDRIVFKDVKGEYVAYDFVENADVGLRMVYKKNYSPYGAFNDILPDDYGIYADLVINSPYAAYKFVDNKWVVAKQSNTPDTSLRANRVFASGEAIVYNSINLKNAIQSASFDEMLAGLEKWADDFNYSFALPLGVDTSVGYGEVIVSSSDPTSLYPCYDGIDNDNDGLKDESDPGCHTDWDVNNPASYNQKSRSEAEDNIKRVPVMPDGTGIEAGAGQSSFSGDGKLIAFSSVTVGGWSWGNRQDIFVYNTTTSVTERINLAPDGSDANYDSMTPAINNEGRYVVFQSSASNLVADDTNGSADIFVRDLKNNTTILVSKGLDGKPAGKSQTPSIGGENGHYISFDSEASNLVPNDTNGQSDVFVYNIDTGTIECVSSAPDGTPSSGYTSILSSASNNVAFSSGSSNLVPNDTNGGEGKNDVFVRNLDTKEIERVNLTSDGKEVVSGSVGGVLISPDGRYVSFYSPGYYFFPDDTEQWADTFVYDRINKTLERVSVLADGQQANSDSYGAHFSADGKYAVFSSQADNLVSGDNNGKTDVFIRNQITHEIKRLSIPFDNTEANDLSYPADITPDGKYILISSGASNLVKGDVNGTGDTFIVKNPFIDFSVPALTQCADGIDNDGDGLIDVADGACHTDGDVDNPNSFDATLDDESKVGAVLLLPTELKQRNESDGAEVGVGKIINEGATDSADSVFLSAKVESPDGGMVALEVEADELYETEDIFSGVKLKSTQVASGEVATIDFAPEGGLYKWKARTVDENGGASDWVEFGNNDATEADFISSNFSFIYLTDVHLGSNTTFLAALDSVWNWKHPLDLKLPNPWYESLSYPRFTDVLYDIEKLDSRPDFILIGGDNVEYNDGRWLEDFKSITKDFYRRTGIEIYFVPGNHERYDSASSGYDIGETDFSGGNDNLARYLIIMNNLDNGVTSLFADDPTIMHDWPSQDKGLNEYNYYFNYKGLQFIGLDSGEDTGKWDKTPESEGLSDPVMSKLEGLAEKNPETSRVIFMHSSVWDDWASEEFDNNDIWGGVLVPDGAISNNWVNFITYCDEHDVQLVLSGHTHENLVINSLGGVEDVYDWAKNKTYPLFLQTQSAGKGDNHGYRIIDVKNGKAIPQGPETNIPKYEKIYSDLDPKNELEFRAYDSSGKEITMKDNGGSEIIIGDKDIYTLFLAGESDRKIVYEDTENSQFEIKNNNSFESGYNFMTQKREEGTEPNSVLKSKNVWGYGINNPEMCNTFGFSCSNGFLVEIEDGGYKALYFKDIKLKSGFSDKVSVDWSEVGINDTWSTTDVKGVDFVIDGNSKTSYDNMGTFMTVDLNSPGELRVFKDGAVTGVVDGEVKEDIPYSMYVPETETVYIFGDTREEVVRDVTTQVVGSYEATYDLSISLSENNEEKVKFMADDVLTNNRTTHQFSVNWDVLEQGGNGVKMETDDNKDGVFNDPVFLDETLSFPKANIGAGVEDYSVVSVEGTKITFDGSGSSDADGSIALYEWDFNEDGVYDASSTEKTIDYTYGDDFAGKVFLKVTDDDGLTNVASVDVKIDNAAPVITSVEDKNVEISDPVNLEASFTDAGMSDTHTASINWGDGVKEGITLATDNPKNISASHNYGVAGNYTATLTVTDDDGAVATKSFAVVVTKRATTLVYDGETTGRYGETTKLSATLADKLGTLVDKNVTFQLGAQTVSAITDSNGKATAEIVIDWIAETYPVKVAFREEGSYMASETQPVIIVKSIKQIKQDALTKLKTLAVLLRQKDLEKAASNMEEVLTSSLWTDEYHLDAKHGNKVFDNEKQVIKNIFKLTEKENLPMCSEIRASLQSVIGDIMFSDKALVSTALSQAKSLTARTPKFSEERAKEIEKAEAASVDALREVGKGNMDKAVDDFKKAWNSIQFAIEFALK